MARTVSAVFKFQGTIEDITHVNSKAYGPHVRAKKNSKTPFVMTAALAESRDRLQLCNQYLRPVFLALRREGCDGRFWSRLVSQQFAELRAGRSMNLECLRGFDCNLQHPLGDVIKSNYDFSATVVHNQLQVRVRLDQHPVVNDELPRTGYQLRVVAIFRDAAGTAHKEVGLGPLTKYGSPLEAVELRIPVPDGRFVGTSVCGDTNQGGGGECMLLLGVVPHLQAQGATKVMSDSGMKVVWVGKLGVGRQESGDEGREETLPVAEPAPQQRGSRVQVAGEAGVTGCGEVDRLTSLSVERGESEQASSLESGDAGNGFRLQVTGCREVEKETGLRVEKGEMRKGDHAVSAGGEAVGSDATKVTTWPVYSFSSSSTSVPVYRYG